MNNYQVQQDINSIIGFSTSIILFGFMVGMVKTMFGNPITLDNPIEVAYQYEKKLLERGEKIPPILRLEDAVMRRIGRKTAEEFIREYEWLGYLGQANYYYGFYWGDDLGCVICFSMPPSWQAARGFCGEKYEDRVLLLSRGASTWWAPRNTGSYCIRRVLDDIEKNTRYRIIYAYADPRAGEVGIIYQALNWYYIGTTREQTWYLPKGEYETSIFGFTTRTIPKELKGKKWLEEAGLEIEEYKYPVKHRYVTFLGDKRERKEYRDNLRYEVLPYPKRGD